MSYALQNIGIVNGRFVFNTYLPAINELIIQITSKTVFNTRKIQQKSN